ncbi:MAG TPA: hypothetical protein PLR86_09085 [Planctomycetota bacterium]|nr:hypothetical protein [Planctomycetota bacterium]
MLCCSGEANVAWGREVAMLWGGKCCSVALGRQMLLGGEKLLCSGEKRVLICSVGRKFALCYSRSYSGE